MYYQPLGPAGLTLITPPTAEPLTLDEAKRHCRIDADLYDDDALVSALITAAREYAEVHLNRALLTQSWRVTMDDFPRPPYVGALHPRAFRLPKPALQSVASVKYVATDGTLTVLDPSMYIVDTASLQGRVALAYGQCWPAVLRQANSVTVDFTCGYGDTADTIPRGIRQAMLLLIGHWYENREAVIVSTGRALVTEVPRTVDMLLDAHRVVEF